MEFHKINATDDHQEYAHSGIILDAEETTAFFATFDTVEREFHQIVQDLPKKSTTEKFASDSLQSLKRKASDASFAAIVGSWIPFGSTIDAWLHNRRLT